MVKFVNLHCHDTFSVFDGFGYPKQFMERVHETGGEALAITNHGNMNSMAYQLFAAEEMKKEGKIVKPIYGIEAYIIPSFKKWRTAYETAKENKELKKKKEEEINATVIEDDLKRFSRTKKTEINKRSHILLLAQNQDGLKNLFQLVYNSYKRENFYRYPRIDYDMLRSYNKGIIATSACVGGVYSSNFFDNYEKGTDYILLEMRKTTQAMLDIFEDRWYGELQWNDFVEQHDLNQLIIQLSVEMGFKLVSTADAHYPRPELWKDRFLYKKLGWLNSKDSEQAKLPETVEEIGYELYPKSAEEMWRDYKKYSLKHNSFYEDDTIEKSLDNTYDIAMNRIENVDMDRSYKLPSSVVPTGQTEEGALARRAVAGLKAKGLYEKKEYVDRLKHELRVVKDRGYCKYFLAMKKIIDKSRNFCLTGPGRGSAGGSLIAYVLNITHVDPIKYGLLFERFLSEGSSPDIDCLWSGHEVRVSGGYKKLRDVLIGDVVINEFGENSVVSAVFSRNVRPKEKVFSIVVQQVEEDILGIIIAGETHKFILSSDRVTKTKELKIGDSLKSIGGEVVVLEIEKMSKQKKERIALTDISLLGETKSFQIVPLDVIEVFNTITEERKRFVLEIDNKRKHGNH